MPKAPVIRSARDYFERDWSRPILDLALRQVWAARKGESSGKAPSMTFGPADALEAQGTRTIREGDRNRIARNLAQLCDAGLLSRVARGQYIAAPELGSMLAVADFQRAVESTPIAGWVVSYPGDVDVARVPQAPPAFAMTRIGDAKLSKKEHEALQKARMEAQKVLRRSLAKAGPGTIKSTTQEAGPMRAVDFVFRVPLF